MTEKPAKRDLRSTLDGCTDLFISCFGTIVFLSIFMLVGIGATCWGLVVLFNARASANWPPVPGVIVASGVELSTDSEGHESWEPKVTYEYVVAGTQHTGVRIRIGENSFDDPESAEEALASYPTGQPVQVYYDPDLPGQSVLEPGIRPGSYFLLVTGLSFMLLAIVLAPVLYFAGVRE